MERTLNQKNGKRSLNDVHETAFFSTIITCCNPTTFFFHFNSMDPIARILAHIQKNSYYILPHRFFTSEDGTIPIRVTLWKTDPITSACNMYGFGISVHTRGEVDHQMFNIFVTLGVPLTEEFLRAQIERVKRILARPLRPLCGTLGPYKSDMMELVGMDKKALGIDNCCVCARETALKTRNCSHNVCLYCLMKVDRCPVCRNEDVSCACCDYDEFQNENEDETDDDFASV